MVFCSSCGKQLEDDANFCPTCGTRTEKGLKDGVTIPWTETQVKQDVDRALREASRALDDGVRIARSALQDVAQRVDNEVRTARERQRQREQAMYCRQCGHQNQPGARFCSGCGQKLD